MSKKCPICGTAISQDCVECEDKICRMQRKKYKIAVIGIDQSYQNTGISISADGKIRKIRSVQLDAYKTKSEKRAALKEIFSGVLRSVTQKADKTIVVIERIRLFSQGFLNIEYIKSIGALNTVFVDLCYDNNIPIYSVDTRCWKSAVLGTSKGAQNDYGVPEEKWPCVKWVIEQGFESSIKIILPKNSRKEKGTYRDKDNNKCVYNNDACDSAAISYFWFVGDRDKLQKED